MPITPQSPQLAARAPERLRDFSRSLPMALLRARESVMSRFRPLLREHDLTEQQWRVLRALEAAPTPLRLSEIGDRTFLSLPSLSRVSKALDARGLTRRTVDAEDLRAAQVTLSAKGRRLIARIAPASEGHYAEIAEAIGFADLEKLYALLDRVREKLSDGQTAPGEGD